MYDSRFTCTMVICTYSWTLIQQQSCINFHRILRTTITPLQTRIYTDSIINCQSSIINSEARIYADGHGFHSQSRIINRKGYARGNTGYTLSTAECAEDRRGDETPACVGGNPGSLPCHGGPAPAKAGETENTEVCRAELSPCRLLRDTAPSRGMWKGRLSFVAARPRIEYGVRDSPRKSTGPLKVAKSRSRESAKGKW